MITRYTHFPAEGRMEPDPKGDYVTFADFHQQADALQTLWAFLEDLRKSNPGYMGKLVLQDYGQMNTAFLKTSAAIAKVTK